jgi:hypothetical protein
MRELLKMWWRGVKLFACFFLVSLVWSGLGWAYSMLAGWMPRSLFEILGGVLVVTFFPITLSIAFAEMQGRKDERA